MGMRQLACKGMVAALTAGCAIGLTATAATAETTRFATHTTLTLITSEVAGKKVLTYSATVSSEDGSTPTGVVTLAELGNDIASAALDASGKAEIRADGMAAGNHTLVAAYAGDSTHINSQSMSVIAQAAPAADSFALSISPASVSVTSPGQAATGVATITAGSSFTGFLSLSCAGAPVNTGSSTDSALPVGVSCTFTPPNLQVKNAGSTATSDFTIQTTGPAGQLSKTWHPDTIRDAGHPLVLAVLLPGVIGLGVLGRKRKLFGRAALVLLVGAVGVLGTTACNPRYYYLNHPPTANYGTIPGTYTLTIWAQTSNGVTASEQFQTLSLTVNK